MAKYAKTENKNKFLCRHSADKLKTNTMLPFITKNFKP